MSRDGEKHMSQERYMRYIEDDTVKNIATEIQWSKMTYIKLLCY